MEVGGENMSKTLKKWLKLIQNTKGGIAGKYEGWAGT